METQKFLSDEVKDIVCNSPSARTVKVFSNSTPRRATVYVVFSWYAPHNRWKMWNNMFASQTAANDFSKERLLLSGHTEAVVVEVNLPGSNNAS